MSRYRRVLTAGREVAWNGWAALAVVATTVLLVSPGCSPEVAVVELEVELDPSWDRPDPRLVAMEVAERVEAREGVVAAVRVENAGAGSGPPAELVWRVDGEERGRTEVAGMRPGEGRRLELGLGVLAGGRHVVEARLEVDPAARDGNRFDNAALAIVHVEGGDDPPELELAVDIEGRVFGSAGGETVPLVARNPGWAATEGFPLAVELDGEVVASWEVPALPAGATASTEVPLPALGEGMHWVSIDFELPPAHRLADRAAAPAWQLLVRHRPRLRSDPLRDQWLSIGPAILDTKDVGRIDRVVQDPTRPSTLYVSAPTGGVWKTINGGQMWVPLTDGLESLNARALALDPGDADVVYSATYEHPAENTKGGGWFKSIDGGNSWNKFAPPDIADMTYDFEVRRSTPGEVLIYATTSAGLRRYESSDPRKTTATLAEWPQIKSGHLQEIAVDPGEPKRVYVSDGKSIWRTEKGDTLECPQDDLAKCDAQWTQITAGLPSSTEISMIRLDVFDADPRFVYAAVSLSDPKKPLEIFVSSTRGDSWSSLWAYDPAKLTQQALYNPFVRVHPTDRNLLYFGGVPLFKLQRADDSSAWQALRFIVDPQGVRLHADHKDMLFAAGDPSTYFLTNDGGVYRGRVSALDGAKTIRSDSWQMINFNLRTTQFYDMDLSHGKAELLIAGAQDNGTSLWKGQPTWTMSRGGIDGNYSVINAWDDTVMYAQNQYLSSVARNDRSGDPAAWKSAANGLPSGSWDFYTGHPDNKPLVLLAEGLEVHFTDDGGKSWVKKGPRQAQCAIGKYVTSAIIQPTTGHWIVAGVSARLCISDDEGATWHELASPPAGAAWVRHMAFSPLDHKVLYALYGDGWTSRRVWRHTMDAADFKKWTPLNVTDNFPVNGVPFTVAADAHDPDVLYAGTDRGVWRRRATLPATQRWQPYNDGLPYVKVNELLTSAKTQELFACTWGRGVWKVKTGP